MPPAQLVEAFLRGLAASGAWSSASENGHFPRAVLETGETYFTEFAPNVRVRGSPGRQAWTLLQLRAIVAETTGRRVFDALGSPDRPATIAVVGDPEGGRSILEGCPEARNTGECVVRLLHDRLNPQGALKATVTSARHVAMALEESGITVQKPQPSNDVVQQALAGSRIALTLSDVGVLWRTAEWRGVRAWLIVTGAIVDDANVPKGFLFGDPIVGAPLRAARAQEFGEAMMGGAILVPDAAILRTPEKLGLESREG